LLIKQTNGSPLFRKWGVSLKKGVLKIYFKIVGTFLDKLLYICRGDEVILMLATTHKPFDYHSTEHYTAWDFL
jgi:hypothetical protein